MKNMPRIFSILLGIVFILSATYYYFCLPFNIGVPICIVLGFGFLLFGIFYSKLCKSLRIIGNLLIATYLALCISLFLYGVYDTTTENEDFVVVLGCGLNGETVTANLAYRLDEALKYSEKNQDVTAIVSGGQGKNEDISEAEAMEKYIVLQRGNSLRIIRESKSASTQENLQFSKEIMDGEKSEYSVCIVTNNYHILRAKIIAKSLGLNATHIGAKTDYRTVPVCYTREMIAIISLLLMRI